MVTGFEENPDQVDCMSEKIRKQKDIKFWIQMDQDYLLAVISNRLFRHFLALAGENIECYEIRQKVCDMPITMPAIQ